MCRVSVSPLRGNRFSIFKLAQYLAHPVWFFVYYPAAMIADVSVCACLVPSELLYRQVLPAVLAYLMCRDRVPVNVTWLASFYLLSLLKWHIRFFFEIHLLLYHLAVYPVGLVEWFGDVLYGIACHAYADFSAS